MVVVLCKSFTQGTPRGPQKSVGAWVRPSCVKMTAHLHHVEMKTWTNALKCTGTALQAAPGQI